jgi:hypothetical protein
LRFKGIRGSGGGRHLVVVVMEDGDVLRCRRSDKRSCLGESNTTSLMVYLLLLYERNRLIDSRSSCNNQNATPTKNIHQRCLQSPFLAASIATRTRV